MVALENKVRELEMEVEMEQSHKTRSERTIKKLKDSLADVRLIFQLSYRISTWLLSIILI